MARVSRCCTTASCSPARCPTRSWPCTTGTPASTSRSASTRASACRCSRRWPPTCRCSPTRAARRARDARRRRRAVRAEGSRVRRRAARRSSRSTTTCAQRVIAGQRRRLADFGDARIERELRRRRCGIRRDCIVKTRLHRPALRHRDPRRLRVPLPADRRAARAEARRRGADDLRARLRHLEERVPGGRRPRPRRHGPALRQRADARHRRVQPLLRLDLQQPAHAATTRWSG